MDIAVCSDERPAFRFTMAYGCLDGNYGRIVSVARLVIALGSALLGLWRLPETRGCDIRQ